jgi:septum formation protein
MPSDATRSPPRAGIRIVLASASPRRQDLLTAAGVAFEVVPAEIEEERAPGEQPTSLSARLAREKALTVARRLGPTPARLVLGADTVVVLGEAVLGKPRSAEHARSLLGRLQGRSHVVVTGVAVAATDTLRVEAATVASRVTMRAVREEEIRAYVAGGEPLDKAGAYALQGEGRRFVESVEGSESNVIGLPLDETLDLLERAARRLRAGRESASP